MTTLHSVAQAANAPSARASHILVESEAECDKLAAQLKQTDDVPTLFAQLAKDHSKCPSSGHGGDLGQFGRGAMVREFDAVVFEKPKGIVHKVHTQFGWHLVLVVERSGVDEAAILADMEKSDEEDMGLDDKDL